VSKRGWQIGETINEIVARLRLERAVALLRSSPNLSVTEAAFASGFRPVAVFSRAFRKYKKPENRDPFHLGFVS
jgi:transcriptional regulator GlxA family with amidase domain